ncbi:Uncharacterised protein [uncultured Clostridium sp.]|uniref:hypothetical protein n=1 Tax=Intestinimonas butyriciproducens TaxID=1297617 RepID=UPI0008205C43|nr:hypothetical protein [Intestinimonas butyriciproducens]OLR66413.1 hypothetical protein BIV19_01670 [Intestinimonas butyriciproducens]SCI79869.1 Uncharacterised protein [uncultured Clostridium sp.]
MKRQTSRAALFLLATLTLISWLGASFLAQRAGELSRGAVIRWEAGGGISPVQLLRAERYAREDGGAAVPTAALWREHREGYVEGGAGRCSTSAAVLELFGDGGEVWPAAFRYGNYPARGDETGCAVDEAAADALWGSARVVGQAVLWKGKTYYVRGVMKGSGGLLLGQGGEDAEPWPNLLLRLFQRGRALTAAPLLLVCYLPPALLGAGTVLWCAGAPWSVPERFIPTRWSDFEFWVRLFSGGMEKLRGYLTLAAVQRDLRYGALAAGCALLSLTALALAVLAAERAGVRTERVFAVRACAVWALTFGIALVFAPFGGVKVERPLWLLPAAWLLSDWCLERHRRFWDRRREEERGDEIAMEPSARAGGGGGRPSAGV